MAQLGVSRRVCIQCHRQRVLVLYELLVLLLLGLLRQLTHKLRVLLLLQLQMLLAGESW